MARTLEHFPNLVTMFFTRAAEGGDAPFLWTKIDGRWTPRSWADTARQIAALATALKENGLRRGDRVVLVSENRPEWLIADIAIMAAGGVTVPAYITNTPRDHAHILGNSGARMAIVSTAKLAATLLPAIIETGRCDALIAMEPPAHRPQGVRICDWDALIAAHPTDVAATAATIDFTREDLACLIYTSGTGGTPRGVRQHHGAVLASAKGAAIIVAEDFGIDEEMFLSFLPLSHAYEHTAGQYLPIMLGGQISYAEGLDKLSANIEEVRPTIMVVVPRLFELLRTRILKQVEKGGGVSRWLFARAVKRDRLLGPLLDVTVRKKVQGRFGGRIKAMVSGGAPLNPEIGQFFQSLGLTLLQGYGQTEAAPIISCNRPRAGIDPSTVGPPLDGVEVRIAEDGEILVRGEIVMHGYWQAEEETARALEGGWLHTGDVGHFDGAGRLVITDRKKDLIVNDKGDNVSPQRVEGMLTMEPEIGQAMVVGDRRPHLVGLIVPDAVWLAEQGAMSPEAIEKAMAAAVERVNRTLSTTEKVRRITMADEPFTTDNGEMTPSLKIRRHILRARYGERLDGLYGK
ncbi:AMP-dependent synthetase/ligase [Sphingomonas naphthae]|uniref:AMP-dependent synthetase/ligase n=1 Tax=Sphingomonas naphthae TaxID=1813468 RepID=A0ABY7TK96_9SPHN|nr:AMP-dependent synthetase/ligase [Sphingomonas naphthae]WCT73651.1 AMP-dependent synthetase/ligase [Sphingomonas naphthae]